MDKLVFKQSTVSTVLDNVFIDEYMSKASSPVFVLVYIYALRCAAGQISVSNSDIAEKFGILESDVIKAWKFWDKQGVINYNKEEIEFCNIQKPEPKEEAAAVETETKTKAPIPKTEPVYNPSDIDKIIEEKPDTKAVIQMAENILCKILSPNEVAVIVKMYDWLGMSEDVMNMLLNYCKGKGNKNMAYIEKVAMDWNEKNISTLEQAEEYLDMISNDYKDIMGFCGVRDRTPTKSQQDYMYKWINELKMPLPIIEEACTRTINNTGKASFKYINAILEDWHKKGVKTVKGIEAADTAYIQKQQEKKQTKTAKTETTYKNKFINYDQPTYTDEQWQEIMERKARKNKQ